MPNFARDMSSLLSSLKRPFLGVLLMLLLQLAAGLVVIAIPGITSMSLALIAADIIIALACLWLYRRKKPAQPISNKQLSLINYMHALGVVATLLGIFALDLLTELLAIPNLMAEQMLGLLSNPWGVVAVALAAPLGEEMLFRWGIMGHLMHRGMGAMMAIIVSALLFGIIHINPAQVFFATLTGILLGLLYWRSGSVVLPILVHILNNGTACLQVWLMGDEALTFSMVDTLGGPAMAWGVATICALLCVVGMRWYTTKK